MTSPEERAEKAVCGKCPAGDCYNCDMRPTLAYVVHAIREAVAEERERLLAIADAGKVDFCNTCQVAQAKRGGKR